jgi:hypothetical protein
MSASLFRTDVTLLPPAPLAKHAAFLKNVPRADERAHAMQCTAMRWDATQLAAMENFFSYFTIGNVAFVLYSGGYSYSDSKPLFAEVRRVLRVTLLWLLLLHVVLLCVWVCHSSCCCVFGW